MFVYDNEFYTKENKFWIKNKIELQDNTLYFLKLTRNFMNNKGWETNRLQNNPYFCIFKYARKVKQKVWNEVENRERDLRRDVTGVWGLRASRT